MLYIMTEFMNLYVILLVRIFILSNIAYTQGTYDIISKITTLELDTNTDAELKETSLRRNSRTKRDEKIHVVIDKDNNIQLVDRDRIFFPGQIPTEKSRISYTREEAQCYLRNQAYYNGSCIDLLEKQHCNEGEWLILNLNRFLEKPAKIVPKCDKRKCDFFEVYWLPTKTCQNFTNESLCPAGNIAVNDVFGNGACKCKPTYGLHEKGVCYSLYTQGPCASGQLFVEDSDRKTECVINDCKNSSLVRYKVDNECYALNTAGEHGPPCEPNYNFTVSENNRIPECVSTVTTFVLSPPTACPTTTSEKGCAVQASVEAPPLAFFFDISLASERVGKS